MKHVLPTDSRVSLLGVDGREYNVLGYMDLYCSMYCGNRVHVQAVTNLSKP